MKILFFLRYSRDQASSRVRGFNMAKELKRKGIDYDIIHGYGKKQIVRFLFSLLKYDIVYFQKRYQKIDIKLNKIARTTGKRTFFDIDDAPGSPKMKPIKIARAAKMIAVSSEVVVGSRKLKTFAQKYNNNVHLIPSSIDLRHYRAKEDASGNKVCTTLGWIGNGTCYKKDLLMLTKPLEAIGKRHDVKFTIVGALGEKVIYKNFGKMKNVKTEIIDSINWSDPENPPSIISTFDIGLYPLLDSGSNQYKCGFKALEYMALGIPVVSSPVAENTFIIENGKDGFFASNESEWTEKISYLVENKDVRMKIGRAARMKIERSYSLDVCANKLLSVFK